MRVMENSLLWVVQDFYRVSKLGFWVLGLVGFKLGIIIVVWE